MTSSKREYKMKPFDFAGDPKLPSAIAMRMQAVADERAARGFISPDGQTHTCEGCRDVYDAGHGVLSTAYRKASMKGE
ncbi:MAG: hypothetical protein RQ750_18160 [Roseovarius sp.]|nr:hypothetical protein [Roseovarius sp.]